MLFKLLFLWCISVGLLDLLLKGRDSVSGYPLALPDLSPLIFKYPELSPTDFQNLMLWGVIFSM